MVQDLVNEILNTLYSIEDDKERKQTAIEVLEAVKDIAVCIFDDSIMADWDDSLPGTYTGYPES